jgi:hypothetical protein
MKSKMLIVTVLTIGCGASVVMAADGVPKGDQLKVRDRLQTFSPTCQQDKTRLQECLPAELKASVVDMTQARDKYQQQLRDQQKDVVVCTEEKRDMLRDQLKDQLKDQLTDQAKDREQIRERLLELRQNLPTHQELMEQAREKAGAARTDKTARRGE